MHEYIKSLCTLNNVDVNTLISNIIFFCNHHFMLEPDCR